MITALEARDHGVHALTPPRAVHHNWSSETVRPRLPVELLPLIGYFQGSPLIR